VNLLFSRKSKPGDACHTELSLKLALTLPLLVPRIGAQDP